MIGWLWFLIYFFAILGMLSLIAAGICLFLILRTLAEMQE